MKNQLKIFTILTTGRTGSDYLQSCLDGVPGVITLTGKTYFKYFFEKLKLKQINLTNKKETIEEFIKQNKNLFDSDDLEQKIINIDKIRFKMNLTKELNDRALSRNNFIISVFVAYEKTTRNKIDDAKIIVNHSHSIEETNFFLKLFPECKLLITIRDPLSNLMSGIKHWEKYLKRKMGQGHNYYYTKRIISDFEFAKNLSVDKYFIKLENSFKITEKKSLCNFLGIEYSEKINLATYNNKYWIGDKLSTTRTYDGSFNKDILNRPLDIFFSNKDIFCLRYFYKQYYKDFYNNNKKYHFLDKIKFLFLSLSPLSYEKNEIIKNPIQFRSYYFYLKRVILFYSKTNN